MPCAATLRRHREGLKALNLILPYEDWKHIARCALESDMSQAEWMRRVLKASGPLPADQTSAADQTHEVPHLVEA